MTVACKLSTNNITQLMGPSNLYEIKSEYILNPSFAHLNHSVGVIRKYNYTISECFFVLTLQPLFHPFSDVQLVLVLFL